MMLMLLTTHLFVPVTNVPLVCNTSGYFSFTGVGRVHLELSNRISLDRLLILTTINFQRNSLSQKTKK